MSDHTKGPRQKLTPRQKEIALLVGEGLRDKEIGLLLNIESRTVSAQLRWVYLRTGLRGRTNVALWVAAGMPGN